MKGGSALHVRRVGVTSGGKSWRFFSTVTHSGHHGPCLGDGAGSREDRVLWMGKAQMKMETYVCSLRYLSHGCIGIGRQDRFGSSQSGP